MVEGVGVPVAATERCVPVSRSTWSNNHPDQGRIAMAQQPGLDGRHRDKNGEISKKHGNTLISTLRQTYGAGFARGIDGGVRLSDVLDRLDEPSLSTLIQDLPPHQR
jgi:hypothetical protein